MLSTFAWTMIVLFCLALWGIYKFLKFIVCSLRDEVVEARRTKKQAKEKTRMEKTEDEEKARLKRAEAEWDARVAKTVILSKNRRYMNKRHYYHETTFMVYYVNGTHEAHTIENGTKEYDRFMSKLDV